MIEEQIPCSNQHKQDGYKGNCNGLVTELDRGCGYGVACFGQFLGELIQTSEDETIGNDENPKGEAFKVYKGEKQNNYIPNQQSSSSMGRKTRFFLYCSDAVP